jgi:flagellar biosynthesis chaperone FliJ
MPKFTFELEPVLRLRRRQEEEKQRRVAELERERAGIEDRIRAHQASISAAKRDLRVLLTGERRSGDVEGGGGVSLRGARMQANAALHGVARAQRAVVELAGVHGKLDVARLALLRAMAQRKAVEVLRQKRYDEWRAMILRKEQGEIDDIVNARVARRMNEPNAPGSAPGSIGA